MGDEIEVGAGLASAALDGAHQERQAAALVGLGEARHSSLMVSCVCEVSMRTDSDVM